MSIRYEAGLMVLRVVAGIIFFMHGLAKFKGGLGNTAGFFDSIGIPGVLAYAVAIIETVGGIAMIVGLGTRLFAMLFALIMIAAILKVKLAGGLLGNGKMPGYELELALLAISVPLGVCGSRLYSLDSLLFGGGQKQTAA